MSGYLPQPDDEWSLSVERQRQILITCSRRIRYRLSTLFSQSFSSMATLFSTASYQPSLAWRIELKNIAVWRTKTVLHDADSGFCCETKIHNALGWLSAVVIFATVKRVPPKENPMFRKSTHIRVYTKINQTDIGEKLNFQLPTVSFLSVFLLCASQQRFSQHERSIHACLDLEYVFRSAMSPKCLRKKRGKHNKETRVVKDGPQHERQRSGWPPSVKHAPPYSAPPKFTNCSALEMYGWLPSNSSQKRR